MFRYIAEQMHVAQAKILNFHTWNSTTSLKPLQTFLCDSIRKYPHNTQLLYLLVKLRSASSAISPTRRYLSIIIQLIALQLLNFFFLSIQTVNVLLFVL